MRKLICVVLMLLLICAPALSEYGNMGLLWIPKVGVEVPLNTPTKTKTAKEIIDEENNAVYYWRQRGSKWDIIGDHASQGFDAIKNCTLNTYAYIVTPTKSTMYRVIGMSIGHNYGKIITESGHYVTDMKNWADICLYTCNDATGKNISMVFLKKELEVDYDLYERSREYSAKNAAN